LARGGAASAPIELEPLEQSSAWKRWTAATMIIAATFLAYLNTLDNDFVTWDDDKYVRKNPLVIGDKPLSSVWNPKEIEKAKLHFYPLVFTTYWLEHQYDGLNPFVYHFDQMILHALNGVVLMFAMRWLGVGFFVSVVTGAIFALHPTNVASVAWIAERKNTLSCLFYLLSMMMYLQFRRQAGIWRYVLAILFFLLALSAKSAVLMLAPILVLTDRVLDRRWSLASLLRCVPFFLLAAVFAGITMQHEAGLLKDSDNPVDVVLRPLIASRALAHYFEKVVAPVGLVPIYARWPESFAVPGYWVSLGMVLAGGVLLWRYRRRIDRMYFWGLAVFLLSIAPVLGLKHYNLVQFTFVADHYMYFGSQGLFLIVALLLDRMRRAPAPGATDVETKDRGAALVVSPGRNAGVLVFVFAALGACGYLTAQHNENYKDGVAFWEYTLVHNPDCMPANLNLGNHYVRQKDDARAMPYYREAARLLPTFVRIRRTTAGCARRLDLQDEAVRYYEEAVECARPKGRNLTTEVQMDLAYYLRSIGRRDEALVHYQEVLTRHPENSRALAAIEQLQGF
jgi:hypothetical protein